jgi:hypothetical protein
MLSSIGPHQFLILAGQIVPPHEQVDDPVQRRGVDGTGLWRTGRRGDKFSLRSKVDQPSLDAARLTFRQYQDLIGQDPQQLVQDDFDFSQQGFQVFVLKVHLAALKTIRTAVGGLNPPSLAWLEGDWELIAVET